MQTQINPQAVHTPDGKFGFLTSREGLKGSVQFQGERGFYSLLALDYLFPPNVREGRKEA